MSLSPGGALLPAERRSGVVLWNGSHRPLPGGSGAGSPPALQASGLEQPELPQEDDGGCAGGRSPSPNLPDLCCPQAATDFAEKLRAYGEVCRNFRPVFRFFCMERFLDPAVWMEKRLSYTRSVATSSIGRPA